MKACPTCKSTDRNRRRRRFLLKWIPFSKAYRCGNCLTAYLYVEPLNISILIKKAIK